MGITLVTGPANAGKARVLMDGVRRHLAHGQEPLLVVPTRADTEHYRRELAGEGAAIGARVERFDGLIGEAILRAGLGGPVLGALARERVLAAILARGQEPLPVGRRGGEAEHDRREGTGEDRAALGLVRALGEVIAELQVRRVTPARLQGALAAWAQSDGGGAPAEKLGGLFGRYMRLLEELGRPDSEQLAVRALERLRRAPALWGATPVLFYGFDDLTRLQLDAIETLGGVVGASVTVSLAYEPGRTAFAGRAATFQALLPLSSEHRELKARAEYYAPGSRAALSHLERSLFEAAATRLEPGAAVRLLEGGGERAELELVAQEIGRLLAGGMAAEEIAIVIRAPAASEALLEEVFSEAGIPVALQRPRPFGASALGRALIGLLRCAAGEGELGDLLAWLRAPGLLERAELADELELRGRRQGAKSAASARALWEERHWPLEAIDQLREAAGRGAAALAERAARELQWLFSAPRRRSASLLGEEEMEEARALAAARAALGELGELARLAPELAPGDAAELARTLEGLEILGSGHPAPGTVAVLDPLALRARRVRALFLCRLQEGVFPAPARPRPFLAEDDRRRLAETSGLRLGEPQDALAAERHLLYAVLSRPEERLYLSWHVADDDGEPRSRSLFVDDVCDLFQVSLGERRERRALGAVDSLAPGEGRDVRPFEGLGGPPPSPSAAREGLAPLRDEGLLAELRSRPWSASSLEAWIDCPARWFLERLLRPGDFEAEPEPLARGALAHDALRDTLEGLRRETGSARLTPGRLALARELLQRALRENELGRPLSLAPERLAAARRRLQADLDRYLDYAATVQGPLEPSFLEVEFGFARDDPEDRGGPGGELPAFELGEGVALRGRIDRIDVGEGGQAVVYDYKNRAAPPAAKWIGEASVQVALYMLAAEELLGVQAVGGFYQPLSGQDLRARGVLEIDSGVEIECVRGEAREHAEVRELLNEALALALGAAAEATRGEFEARPRSCGWNGRGCLYPTICRCER